MDLLEATDIPQKVIDDMVAWIDEDLIGWNSIGAANWGKYFSDKYPGYVVGSVEELVEFAQINGSEIFECVICGWWYGGDETEFDAKEPTCTSCYED